MRGRHFSHSGLVAVTLTNSRPKKIAVQAQMGIEPTICVDQFAEQSRDGRIAPEALLYEGQRPVVEGRSTELGGQWTANRVPTVTGDSSVVWMIFGWLLI